MAVNPPALDVAITRWPMKVPFVIHGYAWEHMDVVTVTLTRGAHRGRGEGAPLFYNNETAANLAEALQIISSKDLTVFEHDRQAVPTLPTGARNALDAAFIDLQAKETGKSAHSFLGLEEPQPVKSLATITLNTPEAMAAQARFLSNIPILKLKLGGPDDLEAAAAVRAARPDAVLITDVNCGWTFTQLKEAVGELVSLDFAMIEQPLPPEDDIELRELNSPIPLCADESCRTLEDVDRVKDRYDMINIKLDKCGGLTEALKIVQRAQSLGLGIMVGNMLGSSLAMAPAFYLAQSATFADLDGPLYLTCDCDAPMRFDAGLVHPPSADLWG